MVDDIPGRLYLCRDGNLRTLEEIETRAEEQRQRNAKIKVKGMRPLAVYFDEAADFIAESAGLEPVHGLYYAHDKSTDTICGPKAGPTTHNVEQITCRACLNVLAEQGVRVGD